MVTCLPACLRETSVGNTDALAVARHEGSDALGWRLERWWAVAGSDQRAVAAARGWLCCSYVRTPVGMSRRYVSQVARQQKVIFEIAKKYRGLRAGPENGSRGYSECALSGHGAAATYGC